MAGNQKSGRRPKNFDLALVQSRVIPEQAPEQEEIPSPPEHLEKDARRYWVMFAPALAQSKLLTNIDKPMFARYCELYADYAKIKKQLEKTGYVVTTYEEVMVRDDAGRMVKDENGIALRKDRIKSNTASSEFTVLKNLHDMLKGIEKEFGMSPASRLSNQIGLSEESEEPTPEQIRSAISGRFNYGE